jgi:hypothetical protein
MCARFPGCVLRMSPHGGKRLGWVGPVEQGWDGDRMQGGREGGRTGWAGWTGWLDRGLVGSSTSTSSSTACPGVRVRPRGCLPPLCAPAPLRKNSPLRHNSGSSDGLGDFGGGPGSVAPPGLGSVWGAKPTAHAVGYRLAVLRTWSHGSGEEAVGVGAAQGCESTSMR